MKNRVPFDGLDEQPKASRLFLARSPFRLRFGAALPREHSCAIEVREHRHLCAKNRRLERLLQEIDRPARVRAQEARAIDVTCGHEDDRRSVPATLGAHIQLERRLLAVHTRHFHVEQDDRELSPLELGERFLPRLGGDDLVLGRREGRLQRKEIRAQVVDEKNRYPLIHHSMTSNLPRARTRVNTWEHGNIGRRGKPAAKRMARARRVRPLVVRSRAPVTPSGSAGDERAPRRATRFRAQFSSAASSNEARRADGSSCGKRRPRP